LEQVQRWLEYMERLEELPQEETLGVVVTFSNNQQDNEQNIKQTNV
jgi:hypothetical protein